MECPYCRGGLEPGNLYAAYGGSATMGYWYPAEVKPLQLPTAARLNKFGGFRLCGGNPAGLRSVEAWYCRACNRLTIFNAKTR